MTFKKLALASAVAMVPAMSFAMEEVDDALLSGVTGQDGITLSLDLNLSQNILIEDDNGYAASANYNTAGAINIQGMNISGTGVDISIDAGGHGTNNTAMLAVQIDLTGGLTIDTGAIYVSNTDGAFNVSGTSSQILASTQIVLPNTTSLRIELGSEETNFLTLSGDIGTLTLNNLSLADASSSQTISMTSMTLTGLLTTGLAVNVEAAGLVVDLTGTSMSNVGVDIVDLTLGGAPAIGDVRITGLDLTGTTLTISGH